MLLAAIGDIHGNLPALQAVLNEIEDAGILTILNTGDNVVGYPWPNEVIEMLREKNIPTTQGEMDRLATRFVRKQESLRDKLSNVEYEALRWTHENTRSENLEHMKDLPKKLELVFEDIPIFLCHGTPSTQMDQLGAEDSPTRYRRERETANARLIICGRTHRPHARLVDDALFVNPGSVGMPPDDGALASYAIINTESEPWSVEFRNAVYDMCAVEQHLSHLGLERP